MPLPLDTCLSLLPHTNTGESGFSRPKQAIIVRMSAESLDALQMSNGEQPALEIDFGNVPGIHIGNSFYTMKAAKDDTNNELYLRTTSAARNSTSLKHYANVTGKFSLDRELNSKIKDKLRETTTDAAKEKGSHRTIFLDSPPSTSVGERKRKDQPSSLRNSIGVDKKMPSPQPPKPKLSDVSTDLCLRIVHFLALSERTFEMIMRKMAGPDSNATSRQEVLDALNEVAEPTSPIKRGEDLNARVWYLKTEAWRKVRPYEFPKLQDKDRLAMARTGRQKLSRLGIKESDPLWQHFITRRPIQDHSADPSSSHASRDKSTKVISTTSKVKKPDATSQPTSKPALGRKLPGTGFKLRKTAPTVKTSAKAVVSKSEEQHSNSMSGRAATSTSSTEAVSKSTDVIPKQKITQAVASTSHSSAPKTKAACKNAVGRHTEGSLSQKKGQIESKMKERRLECASYTSSEDERPVANEKNIMSNGAAPLPSEPQRADTPDPLRNIPKDYATCKARYQDLYCDYLVAYRKAVVQKCKMTNIIACCEAGKTPTEEEVSEVLSHEELRRLGEEYRGMHDELMALRAAFE